MECFRAIGSKHGGTGIFRYVVQDPTVRIPGDPEYTEAIPFADTTVGTIVETAAVNEIGHTDPKSTVLPLEEETKSLSIACAPRVETRPQSCSPLTTEESGMDAPVVDKEMERKEHQEGEGVLVIFSSLESTLL